MRAVDIVRLVAIGEGLLSFFLSTLSLYYFSKRNPPYGVAQHVRRVTFTYLSFVIYGLVEIATHIGADFRWQLVALMVVFTLATHAQVPLLAYEREAVEKAYQARRLGD